MIEINRYTSKEIDDMVMPVLMETRANYHIYSPSGNPAVRILEVYENDVDNVCAHLLISELNRMDNVSTNNNYYLKHQNSFIL